MGVGSVNLPTRHLQYAPCATWDCRKLNTGG